MKLKIVFFIFSLYKISIAYSMNTAEELSDFAKTPEIIFAKLEKSGVTKRNWNIEQTHLQAAAILYARYCIIGQLDAACCYDTNTKKRLRDWIEKQSFHLYIKNYFFAQQLNQIFQEQFECIEEAEKDGVKHSLSWIERYSFDSFGDYPRKIKFPQEDWKEKRSAALIELKKEFVKQ